jgi:dsDNA-specific endonuclease/ATPase MutS2
MPRRAAFISSTGEKFRLAAGIFEVRIIHGRGTGVQRDIVRSILAKHPRVLSFQDAPAEAGGWGATIVTLKKS